MRVGGNIGWASGPIAAGLIAASAGDSGIIYKVMFAGTAALMLAVLVFLALLVRESLPRVEGHSSSTVHLSKLRAALSDSSFVVLLAVGFLLYYIFARSLERGASLLSSRSVRGSVSRAGLALSIHRAA